MKPLVRNHRLFLSLLPITYVWDFSFFHLRLLSVFFPIILFLKLLLIGGFKYLFDFKVAFCFNVIAHCVYYWNETIKPPPPPVRWLISPEQGFVYFVWENKQKMEFHSKANNTHPATLFEDIKNHFCYWNQFSIRSD